FGRKKLRSALCRGWRPGETVVDLEIFDSKQTMRAGREAPHLNRTGENAAWRSSIDGPSPEGKIEVFRGIEEQGLRILRPGHADQIGRQNALGAGAKIENDQLRDAITQLAVEADPAPIRRNRGLDVADTAGRRARH